MPYKNLSELPKSVRDNLPPHAQEIYCAAFNNAFKEYRDPKKRYKGSSQEETAHKVAWAAVKKKYIKKSEEWEKINNDS